MLANGQFNDGDDDDDVDNLCSALCLRHSSGRSLPPASHHEDDDGFHDNDLDLIDGLEHQQRSRER